ncbi:hypothetical protein WA158_003573 [Blastocystis sp. Blastoise]
MSFINPGNKFFDDDDFAYNSIAKARINYLEKQPLAFHLNVDLIETPDSYVLLADIPGISIDRIKVTVKDSKICIEGKRKRKVVSDNDVYLITERSSGPFRKFIDVPFNCDAENMKAKIENGLLVLTMNKIEGKEAGIVVKVETEEPKEELTEKLL